METISICLSTQSSVRPRPITRRAEQTSMGYNYQRQYWDVVVSTVGYARRIFGRIHIEAPHHYVIILQRRFNKTSQAEHRFHGCRFGAWPEEEWLVFRNPG